MTSMMRIFRYLKGTSNKGMLFQKNDQLDILAYTDTDWTEDLDNRRSISRYFTLVRENLVTLKSKKKKVVALLTAEPEFCSIAKGIAKSYG